MGKTRTTRALNAACVQQRRVEMCAAEALQRGRRSRLSLLTAPCLLGFFFKTPNHCRDVPSLLHKKPPQRQQQTHHASSGISWSVALSLCVDEAVLRAAGGPAGTEDVPQRAAA